ncbi:MAG: VWA domain-containing protein [Acidobacteria bacterium]|nr:MAG: VWA domain-containing protein [Acidobacteriota bacterium]
MKSQHLALVVAVLLAFDVRPRAQTSSTERQPVFRSSTELVLINVVVRDRSGNVVRGLTQADFSITEDNRPQTITTFDFEELDRPEVATADPTPAPVLTERPTPRSVDSSVLPATRLDMHGRRLLVLFFDLSSMQPEEVKRAIRAAHEYIDKTLSPSDLIAVASFSTALRVDQDFSADRELLAAAVDHLGLAGGQGFENGTVGDPEGTPDNGSAFTVDDTEFNIFNTDRRLQALQTLSDNLAGIAQKKSVIYFSSGMSQTGQDNRVQLRRTTSRANRANVSIYAADMRGLQAIVAGGEASQGSTRGISAFSGDLSRNQASNLSASQDTLTTIAEDTGGRAFFDSNNFGDVFRRVVTDTSAYYVLGYSSTNSARDGRFRRVSVRTKRGDLKLEYRSGYYATRDFMHSTRNDREQQLQDQLLADLSSTDLSVYVSSAYFRIADGRYFVPLSVAVPGYQMPTAKPDSKNGTTIDVLGIVRDSQKRAVGQIRDTIKLGPQPGDDLRRKVVQYETGLEMPPGTYRLKVVLRENESGAVGSYETDLTIPDLRRDSVKVSSIVFGTQFQQAARATPNNPLVRDGRALVPNVTRVVTSGQHLFFHYEVYDPARVTSAGSGEGGSRSVRLLTSLSFFRGRTRVFETPVVETTSLGDPGRSAALFEFDVPASSLTPGVYTCQVNVIDDAAGTFTFPRIQILVRR